MMKDISNISVEGSPVFVYIDHLQIDMNQVRCRISWTVRAPPHHTEVGLDEDIDEGKIPAHVVS